MRIAVIGAGAAGLAALRQISALDNFGSETEVVCYEQTGQIGGTWVYVPEVGKDAYGLPIHSSMYDSLRTNLPKEVMGYPDFPIPDNPKSYLTRTELLAFLKSYHDHFDLGRFIRFYHHLELVEPFTDSCKWQLKVRDLVKNEALLEVFDAVMICNGHYFQPNVPEVPGSRVFRGEQLHSHDYRVPEIFSGKKVVIFGAGPSGLDLALEISKHASRVILSHHLTAPILTKYPDNVVQRPDIEKLGEHEAVFQDSSVESVDSIFYCTGFKYSFPFLDPKCGVRVESNMVTPLWKHLLAVQRPTLAFIGLPYYVCAFSMFDLQVRFALRFWRGEKKFPSKEEMLTEEAAEFERRKSLGLSKRQFHMMGPEQGRYYQDLAETADVAPLPPVLTLLHNESSQRCLDNLTNFREDRFKIVDDNHFVEL